MKAPVLRSLVLRPLLHEKLRSILTVAGIAVGVAVIVAIQLSNQSALRAFRESVDAVAGRANYQVVSGAGVIDEELLLRLQPFWSEGARFAPVLDLDGTLLPDDVPVRILAVDLLSDVHFRDYRYTRIVSDESALPADRYLELFRPDSVVVPESLAAERNLKIGSPVVVRAAGRTATLTVRGILQSQGGGSAFRGSLAVLDISVAQSAFGQKGKLSRIDLIVPDGRRGELLQRIVRVLPPHLKVEPPTRRNDRVEKMLRAFRVNLFALGGVALLVGVFLVYNTVLISVLRRRRDVGVVKTFGVSSGQIIRAFALEGALLGTVGSLLGVALGYALAYSTLELISRTINALYVTSRPSEVIITPLLVIGAVGIGTAMSLAASLQPAIEASRLRPNALIRPGLHQPVAASRVSRLALAAAAALIVAWLATRVPPVLGFAAGGYLAVLFVVAGFSLLAPMALRTGAYLLRRPLQLLAGMAGRLAAGSIPASLRRTAVATAALAVAIAMMVAVAIMVGSFRVTVETWVAQTVRSDLWIRPARFLSNAPQATFPPEISEAISKLDIIEAFDRINGREVIFRDSLISVGGADFDVAASHGNLPMIAPRSHRRALEEATKMGGVVISETLATKHRLRVGDTIELPVARGVRSFPVRGVYRDYSNDRGVAIMDRSSYVRYYEDHAVQTIAVFLRPGVDAEKARSAIEKELGPRFHAFAVSNASIRAEVMRIFDQTFVITYALLAIAVVVAVLGIINTLSALILERGREIALLRVLGMTRREIASMVVFEAGIIGVVATILGSVAGYVLSFILIFVINKQSFGWTIEFHHPPSSIIALLGVTFAATVVSGLVPSRLASRIELTTQLKAE